MPSKYDELRAEVNNALPNRFDKSDVDLVTQLLQQAIDTAILDAKIETLKITHGHQQTGTVINDVYFIHNITMLESERQKLTPSEEES